MKNFLFYLVIATLFISCSYMETEVSDSGEVSFKAVSVHTFQGNLPNGRVAASDWKHIFKKHAVLEITNKITGQVYLLDYNPNDFGEAYTIQLPYGVYSFTSAIEGRDFEKFLPFRIAGEFSLSSQNLDVVLDAETDYALITVKNEHIKSLGIRIRSVIRAFGLLQEKGLYYIYVQNGTASTLEIIDDIVENPINRDLSPDSYNHYHFFLTSTQLNGNANLIELALGAFEYSEEGLEILQNFVMDSEGNSYPVVKIGNQYWMAENLKSTRFCNGEEILVAQPPFHLNPYLDESIPVVAVSRFDINFPFNSYYSIDAANDPRNICPCGWRVSTDQDWKEMEAYLGISEEELEDSGSGRGALQNAAGKIKATDWVDISGNTPGFNANATNETGFTAYAFDAMVPAFDVDDFDPDAGSYWTASEERNYFSYWWSPDLNAEFPSRMVRLISASASDGIQRGNNWDFWLHSIRCVRN